MAATTISERKAREAARRARAASDVVAQLQAYARDNAGRFVIFGSFVDERMRYDSDLDVLIDFPKTTVSAAWDFVEENCMRVGLEPDIHDVSTSKAAFVTRILSNGMVLS